MELSFIIIMGLLGLLVGSFLNVVALRYNTGKSLGGRSSCYSCGHQLRWYELVPLFSWLLQGGRCRRCQSRIAPMYMLGELTTGIFFAAAAMRGWGKGIDMLGSAYLIATVFLCVIFSILVVILIYDVRHKIIPDRLSLSFGVLAFIGIFFTEKIHGVMVFSGFHVPDMWQLLAGILIPLPFVLLWFFSKGKWIGLGDPKLMVGMGFLLGLSQGISAVFLSFWIGSLFAIGLVITNKVLNKRLMRSAKKSILKEELPFAPFLIIATVATVVLNFNLFLY